MPDTTATDNASDEFQTLCAYARNYTWEHGDKEEVDELERVIASVSPRLAPMATAARQLTLVERVADAIVANAGPIPAHGHAWDPEARAAIRVLAAWLREQDPEPGVLGQLLGQISTPCVVMARMLDNEANR